MTKCARALLFFVLSLSVAGPAAAKIRIQIDLDAQRLEATQPNGQTVSWKISSGRRGYETPTGHYEVYRMEADHHSDEYEQAPMPYSMFFSPRGLAIHGTYEGGLGRARSHGCVRLSVANARQLYQWVEKHGATVEITGSSAPEGGAAARRERLAKERAAGRERGDDARKYAAQTKPARRTREAVEPLAPPPDSGAVESLSSY
ncbi:MAG: L,D-transpeptidase [Methylocystis sp.]|nr:L,D-transpeptidase [Methylocystis sp.]